jgi:hypothetical protein
MSLPKGKSNSGIKNILGKEFKKGKSGYHFKERLVVCSSCGITYTSTGPHAKYCSPACKEKNRPEKQKKHFKCTFCQSDFKRRAANNAGKFCSRECSGLYSSAMGSKNYFYKAFAFKPWKCNRCPIEDLCVLIVHHIDHNHDNNALENLEILCANCHHKEHFGNGASRKTKLHKIVKFMEIKNATS